MDTLMDKSGSFPLSGILLSEETFEYFEKKRKKEKHIKNLIMAKDFVPN